MPILAGRCFRSCVTAVKPPAEAPIPITGNEEVALEAFAERFATAAFGLAGSEVALLAESADLTILVPVPFEATVPRSGITKCKAMLKIRERGEMFLGN